MNKRGYVTLLASSNRHRGDSASMIQARDVVLESGAYSPIANAVTLAAQRALGAADVRRPHADGSSPFRIVDSGCGTGYYLRSVMASFSDRALALAMDVSSGSVARSIRGANGIDGLVADTWSSIPIRDGVADLILNVFAPRNLPEYARILCQEGALVVVVPRPDHLSELRDSRAGALSIPDNKADALVADSDHSFALASSTHVFYQLLPEQAVAAALLEMGPSARHLDLARGGMPSAGSEEPPTTEDAGQRPRHEVTVSVDVLLLQKRPVPAQRANTPR